MPLLQALKLLADPTRLRLLLLLQQEELTVLEIQEILGMGQSRISTHLAQLKRARLARDRRSGKNAYYGSAPESELAALKALLHAAAQEIPEAAQDRVALQHLRAKRRDKTRVYFNQLAGKFSREQNCPGRTWKGFAQMLLPLAGPLVVADLGAGEGALSQMLAGHVRQVIAVDNSEKMVEIGANLAREHGLANLEYRLGDLEEPPIAPGSVDLAILSQALHHALNPARALAAAHGILKPGGRIAILDLLAHQFEPARELHADLWLGFSEARLHALLLEAGFQHVQVGVVDREPEPPHFQTVLATAVK